MATADAHVIHSYTDEDGTARVYSNVNAEHGEAVGMHELQTYLREDEKITYNNNNLEERNPQVVYTVDADGPGQYNDVHYTTDDKTAMIDKPNDFKELATLSCCLNIVFGLVALSFSIRSMEQYGKGNRKYAKRHGICAMVWALFAIAVTIAIIIVVCVVELRKDDTQSG